MEEISYRFLPHPSKKISKKNAQTDAVLPFGRYFWGLKLYTILLLSIPYYPSSSTNHRLKLRSSLLNSAPIFTRWQPLVV